MDYFNTRLSTTSKFLNQKDIIHLGCNQTHLHMMNKIGFISDDNIIWTAIDQQSRKPYHLSKSHIPSNSANCKRSGKTITEEESIQQPYIHALPNLANGCSITVVAKQKANWYNLGSVNKNNPKPTLCTEQSWIWPMKVLNVVDIVICDSNYSEKSCQNNATQYSDTIDSELHLSELDAIQDG